MTEIQEQMVQAIEQMKNSAPISIKKAVETIGGLKS